MADIQETIIFNSGFEGIPASEKGELVADPIPYDARITQVKINFNIGAEDTLEIEVLAAESSVIRYAQTGSATAKPKKNVIGDSIWLEFPVFFPAKKGDKLAVKYENTDTHPHTLFVVVIYVREAEALTLLELLQQIWRQIFG